MLKRESFPIERIYVPVKRRAMLDRARVNAIAESMLVSGQTTPSWFARTGPVFALIEGLHRLEVTEALRETTIFGFIVDARKQ